MPAVADARAIALIALAYLISITAYSMLPEAGWPVSATFSSGIGRLMIAFLLPSAAAAIYTLLSRLAREPVAAGATPLKPLYSSIIFVIVLFVVGLHAVVLIGLFAGTAVAYRAVPVLLGFMFVVVGNLLPRTRPNTIVGIRTPATLADRHVWMRVNRFAGHIAVALGIVFIAAAFFPPGRAARDVVSAAATAALALLVIGYRKHPGATRVPTAQRHRYIGMIGWMLRVPVVLIFLYFGAIKFPDHPESPWPKLSPQSG
jgi:immunity protein, SdpI family